MSPELEKTAKNLMKLSAAHRAECFISPQNESGKFEGIPAVEVHKNFQEQKAARRRQQPEA